MPPVGPGLEPPLPASSEAPAHNQVSHALRRTELERDDLRKKLDDAGALIHQLHTERDQWKDAAEKLHGERWEIRP